VLNERVEEGGRADRLRRGLRQRGGRDRFTVRPGQAESRAPRRIRIAGTPVDLCSQAQAVEVVRARLRQPTEGESTVDQPAGGQPAEGPARPLVVASANLDHIHHFGRAGGAHTTIDPTHSTVDWFVLLDGMPLVWRARAIDRSDRWQRLAGSDILADLLSAAQEHGQRVGFLGGTAQAHALLTPALAGSFPDLAVAGYWAPERSELADDRAMSALAQQVRDAGVDLLVVSLGKPRQEIWCARYAAASGAKVCLAFGAAPDFIAGIVPRAPEVLRATGLEWLYRLVLEPRRLARRYLLQGPPALYRLLLDRSA
jgi:N-acetylglucosaminyldiphosphoundecaprenol N-acetyl-beta-D-mannosaminyltransferase